VSASSATTAASRRRAAPPADDPVTRLDLLLLERRILTALDRRLADRADPPRADLPLVPGATPPVVVVVPGETARPPVAPAVSVEPQSPRGEPVTQRPAAPGGTPLALPEMPRAPLDRTTVETEERVTVEEVERLILDTGLFRTTRVTFEFARAALLPSAQEVLDVVGEVLVRSPRLVIFVDGHTDHVGSDATNDRLSAARAAAVRDYLLARYPQIGPERIEARGFGERRPLASNETETGRALNRRVEFVVQNPGDADVAPPLPRLSDAP
jgi:outer membrane protein OmpA-like peptidoglycan-associated protein